MTRSRSLSAWCVDHPVATVLLTFALVLLGLIAFPRLPLAQNLGHLLAIQRRLADPALHGLAAYPFGTGQIVIAFNAGYGQRPTQYALPGRQRHAATVISGQFGQDAALDLDPGQRCIKIGRAHV